MFDQCPLVFQSFFLAPWTLKTPRMTREKCERCCRNQAGDGLKRHKRLRLVDETHTHCMFWFMHIYIYTYVVDPITSHSQVWCIFGYTSFWDMHDLHVYPIGFQRLFITGFIQSGKPSVLVLNMEHI